MFDFDVSSQITNSPPNLMLLYKLVL